jgi:hypothetical protein
MGVDDRQLSSTLINFELFRILMRVFARLRWENSHAYMQTLVFQLSSFDQGRALNAKI